MPDGRSAACVADAIRAAAVRLEATSDTARLDAEVLMAHALGVSRSDLLLRHMRSEAPAGYPALVDRRAAHEPVAYITGQQEFFGLPFMVTPEVLIPRGDSEVLVETALKARPGARSVLDCGTGSGALLLAVLANLPQARGTGIDSSPGALAVAASNARTLGLDERARMMAADWHRAGWSETLGGPFDLILANPPYVENDAELDTSVCEYEPAGALFSGPDGLDDYRILVPQLPALMAPGGLALVEIGHRQAEAVSAIGQAAGMAATIHHDLANRPRVIAFSAVLNGQR
ncbi:peptide chain release factor N(5)-glutamine methyltransferase [Novosphingobium malaysiense]|uniref:Release factor glutamine methyltransferase n=1 Tax=Novosphingobium malaysiense TaxID=1348853 RepID=A0A0B1ZJY2_9SPHN|nr:peptide chain release factor N(5)-glutamine methyltransferase [Novosphingobium malaysiense]KHK89491.1 SAM-dependent methyltransferase [Novosphingobium malaysiense]